ncbi:MAG: hypothetical protein LUD47_07790 [Clostridia bacterium]|nr:hypothetical protein [Clostridia bacterium]
MILERYKFEGCLYVNGHKEDLLAVKECRGDGLTLDFYYGNDDTSCTHIGLYGLMSDGWLLPETHEFDMEIKGLLFAHPELKNQDYDVTIRNGRVEVMRVSRVNVDENAMRRSYPRVHGSI